MVRPTARVLALLELLQSGGTHRVATLAEQLSVDERTVRRYIDHLRDLDIPVESLRGRYGGYRLARHSRMPPLMLGDDEALAVVWALQLAAQSGTGPSSVPAVHSAAAKVRRVLPDAAARRVGAVMDAVDFPATPSHSPVGDGAYARILLDLVEAARDRRPVTFDYTSRQGNSTHRHVEPYGLVAHHGLVYLTGFDRARQAERTFRVDRVDRLQLLEGTFAVPGDTDPVQQVLRPLPAAPHRHAVTVRIRADVAHVRAQLPEMVASVTPIEFGLQADEWLRVVLHAERLDWVAGKLAVIDRPFVIETPPALRDEVHALARRLRSAAQLASEA